MNQQIIQELENAANIIMGAPNLITNDQRRAAESVFLNFRKSKSPYNICREILENSQHDYVKFEAAETLKSALIREWSYLKETDILMLREYLMHYICNTQLPAYVQERLLQVISIMVKRASLDDHGIDRGNILNDIETLILNSDTSKQILGCKLITSLMQEYANTTKSTDVGLPWENHIKAKKEFEVLELRRIFRFCINVLSEVVQSNPPYPQNVYLLLQHILGISECVLTWGTVQHRGRWFVQASESDRAIGRACSLRLGRAWREVFLSPMFLPLMFQVYWKVRDSTELSPSAMTCLVQLSSLHGYVLDDNDNILVYLTSFMENFLKLISSVTIKSGESIGIATIILNLHLFFKAEVLRLPRTLQASYIDEVTRLTCLFIEGASVEDASPNSTYVAAFETIFEAWTFMIEENMEQIAIFKPSAVQIFNTYLQFHLAPPDGRRPREVEEIEQDEDNDRIKFQDHLQAVGLLGRVILDHSLPMLTNFLEDRMGRLALRLQAMLQSAMSYDDSVELDNLFEDIHWLVLISGHTLCMDSVGETPLIPSEIMQHSIRTFNKGDSDLESTLKAMASVRHPDTRPDSLEKCDPAIRLFANVLNLCTLETRANENNLGAFMSPEVGCTLMWFLKRWCLSYLLPIETYYGELSPTLIGALGKDTEGATFVTNFLLEKIQSNMYFCKDEPILIRDTVEIFSDVVGVKEKSCYIVKTEGLWNLIKLQMSISPGALPPDVRRGLYKGFVLVGRCLSPIGEQADYYKEILKPVEQRLKALLCQENFNRIYHEETIKVELIDIMEKLIGVCKGTTNTTVQILFDFIVPILSELPTLLGLYHNYQVIVQLILELFGQCAQNMLCYLDAANSSRLYECTFHAVQTYSKFNVNRFSNDASEEDDNLEDLSLLVDMLSFILSNNWLQIGSLSLNHDELKASDVAIYGLRFLMPLMSVDLLKYPKLCLQYYRFLVLLSDIFPEKVVTLDDEMLKSIIVSVELGITKLNSDVVQICLDFIATMASHVHDNQLQGSKLYELLMPFLQMLMDLTLSQQINSDLTPSIGACMFALIKCYSDQYQMLVQSLINQQTDEIVANRLTSEFNKLLTEMHKRYFCNQFDKFIANVHGFLLIK